MWNKLARVSATIGVAATLIVAAGVPAFATVEDTDLRGDDSSARAESDAVIVDEGISGTVHWTLDSAGALVFSAGTLSRNQRGWVTRADDLRSISFSGLSADGVTAGVTVFPENSSQYFYGLSEVISLDFTNADVAQVRNMRSFLLGMSALTELTFSAGFDTRNVDDMSWMFYRLLSLKKLELPESFVTGNVTNTENMFAFMYSLEELVLPEGFDTGRVEDMSAMFQAMEQLKRLSLPESFDTSNVTDMSFMFNRLASLRELELPSSFDTAEVRTMRSMFSQMSELSALVLPDSFNPKQVTRMDLMFSGASSLATLVFPENFETTSLENMSYMFDEVASLTTLVLPESFDTSKVTEMGSAFWRMSSLERLVLPEAFDTTSVTNMRSMLSDTPRLGALVLGSKTKLANNTGLKLAANSDSTTGNWIDIAPGTEAAPEGLGFRASSAGLIEATREPGWGGGVFVVEARTKLVFDANGGTGTLPSVDGVTGVRVELPENVLSFAGNTFAGWNTSADGSGTAFADRASGYLPAGVTTLYAQWHKVDSPDPHVDPEPGVTATPSITSPSPALARSGATVWPGGIAISAVALISLGAVAMLRRKRVG